MFLRVLLLSLLLSHLTGCGTMGQVAAPTAVPAEATTRAQMFDKFQTSLTRSGDLEWVLRLEARSLLGRTYGNTLVTVITGKTGFASTVRLGKDGGLYVKDNGDRVYRVGSFTGARQLEAPIDVRWADGWQLKMRWRTPLPFDADSLRLEGGARLTPVTKQVVYLP